MAQEYTSCMKIGHQRLLPPLVTPKTRQECFDLKQKAIAVERRLACRRRQKNQVVTDEIIELFDNSHESDMSSSSFSVVSINVIPATPSTPIDFDSSLSDDTVKTPTQARVIRSNSYVLDTPSPSLLAHMEKMSLGDKMADGHAPPSNRCLLTGSGDFNGTSNFLVPPLSDLVVRRGIFDSDSDRIEWAAGVLGAAVRGYLTRRLFRTEKVQSLIETIIDAVSCAFQLHGNVCDEADFELHGRLVRQVNAACLAFHDVFFALSVREQMHVIATDREMRIRRARRPKSGLSSSSISTTPKSVRSVR